MPCCPAKASEVLEKNFRHSKKPIHNDKEQLPTKAGKTSTFLFQELSLCFSLQASRHNADLRDLIVAQAVAKCLALKAVGQKQEPTKSTKRAALSPFHGIDLANTGNSQNTNQLVELVEPIGPRDASSQSWWSLSGSNR